MRRMRDLIEWIQAHVAGNDLFEMSTVYPDESGVPLYIWISVGDGIRHGPRIKAYLGKARDRGSEVVVTIEDHPQVLHVPRRQRVAATTIEQLVEWVRLNREVLLRFWHNECSSKEATNSLRALGDKN